MTDQNNPRSPWDDTSGAIEHLPFAVVLFTPDARVSTWNRAAGKLLALPADVTSVNSILAFSAEDQLTLHALLRHVGTTREPVSGIFAVPRDDGRGDGHVRVELHLSIAPALPREAPAIVGLFVRVDEMRASRELRDTKSIALGRLASRVGHDFKNLLINIDHAAHAIDAAVRAESSDDIRENAERVVEHARQASELASVIGTLAAHRKSHSGPATNVNRFVERMVPTWQRVLGEGIALRISLCDTPVMVPYDVLDLNKIIVVLLDNARDSLSGTGEVEVRTAYVADAVHVTGNGRPHAIISVSDSGPGVHPSIVTRLFEPFQTTKSGRRGLSLAVVDATMRAAGGLLAYEATPGGRSVFSMYFPQRGQREEQPVAPVMPQAVSKMAGGTETILLVEDSLEVRGFIATWLRELGYTVLEAARWEEAMTARSDRDVDIQLLIADVFLPNTSGRKLSDAMKMAQPTLKTLYISGYEELELKDDRFVPPGGDFMQKPFTKEELARAVRKVLDRPGS